MTEISAVPAYNPYMYENGYGVEQSDEQAVYWYSKAVEQGVAEAQYGLADMYANGRGVEKDDEQAMLWYRKAAGQNHAEAQHKLSAMYAKQMLHWAQQAAQLGDAESQASVGEMYAKGFIVEQDHAQAYAWFSSAAANGHSKATNLRDSVAKKLSSAALIEAQQLAERYIKQY